jgi:hypothetical protein
MLKLIHDQLAEENYLGVSGGWPAIISSLKSLLETGKVLALSPQRLTEMESQAVLVRLME